MNDQILIPRIGGSINRESLEASGDSLLLEEILSLVDGQRSVEDIIRELIINGRDIVAVQNGLNGLVQRGFIEEGLDPGKAKLLGECPQQLDTLSRFSPNESYTASLQFSLEAQEKIGRSRIVLAGDGTGSAYFRGMLEQSGFSEVNTVADSEAVTGMLQTDADLLIYFPAMKDKEMADRLNQWCIDQKVPFLPAVPTAFGMELGPFVIPGQTACYACFELRKAGALKDFNFSSAEYERPLQFNVAFGSETLLLETIKFVTSISEPLLINRVMHLNLFTGASELHPVLKLPRCPACGSWHRLPNKKLWDDISLREQMA